MRFTKWDYLAFPVLAAIAIAVIYGALRLVGFFGLGVVGLVIAFIAVRVDLESDGASGGLFGRLPAREAMSRAERAEFHAWKEWRRRPIFIAQIVAAGFIILGFGFHFLL